MTIKELQATAYSNATILGWNEKHISFTEMIALIHTEVSEALESYRDNEPVSYLNNEFNPSKPCGVASEFADILIRVGHYSELLGIDLEAEVKRKLEYNLSRSYRHGNKKV